MQLNVLNSTPASVFILADFGILRGIVIGLSSTPVDVHSLVGVSAEFGIFGGMLIY